VDVASLVVSTMGLIISLVGFGFGLRQLQKTRSAAEAAEEAAARTRDLAGGVQLQGTTAQLVLIQQQLQATVSEGSSEVVTRALALWRIVASHAQGVLRHDPTEEAKALRSKLATSTAEARFAELALANDQTDSQAATVTARAAIFDALDELNVYVAVVPMDSGATK
jgi:hypothetical protein